MNRRQFLKRVLGGAIVAAVWPVPDVGATPEAEMPPELQEKEWEILSGDTLCYGPCASWCSKVGEVGCSRSGSWQARHRILAKETVPEEGLEIHTSGYVHVDTDYASEPSYTTVVSRWPDDGRWRAYHDVSWRVADPIEAVGRDMAIAARKSLERWMGEQDNER